MTEDNLQTIYNKVFQEALMLTVKYDPQQIAATYMAIAMRLYKTHLTDEGFLQMIRTVMESEVEPYEPKRTLN